MPRARRTLEEASRVNARKHNQRQRDRLPLFMGAGLEDDLKAKGVLRDREPDHLLKTHTAYVARLGQGDPAVWDRSDRFQLLFKRLCPEQYPAALRRWRALRVHHPSLRRAAHNADHWYGLIARVLSRPLARSGTPHHSPRCHPGRGRSTSRLSRARRVSQSGSTRRSSR